MGENEGHFRNQRIKKHLKQLKWCKKFLMALKMQACVIGATGAISKSFRKYMNNIPGNHEVKELQKTAILGTAHILRKVLT